MTGESEPLSTLFEAMAMAQGTIESVTKDNTADAGSYQYQYADLNSVWAAVRGPLTDNDLSIYQAVQGSLEGKDLRLVTRVQHKSGEFVEDGGVPLIMNKGDMQGLGSAMTYARRYGLMAAVGIAPEDDDGVSAGKDEGKPKSSSSDPSWRGPMPRTKLEAAAREIKIDIDACSDTDELIALQTAKVTVEVCDQLQIDLPKWWDHEAVEGDAKTNYWGMSQHFKNKAAELASE